MHYVWITAPSMYFASVHVCAKRVGSRIVVEQKYIGSKSGKKRGNKIVLVVTCEGEVVIRHLLDEHRALRRNVRVVVVRPIARRSRLMTLNRQKIELVHGQQSDAQ